MKSWNYRCFGMLLSALLVLAEVRSELLDVEFQVYLWRQSPASAERESTGTSGTEMRPYVAPEIKYFRDGMEDARPIVAAEGRVSDVYRYRGANPLLFFREVGEGEERHRYPLGRVELPPGVSRVLLLFFPDESREQKYRILSLVNSRDQLQAGHALVYNLAPTNLLCQVGKHRFQLDAASFEQVELSDIDDFMLMIQIADKGAEGSWDRRHLERKMVNPDSSWLFFISPHPAHERRYWVLGLENRFAK